MQHVIQESFKIQTILNITLKMRIFRQVHIKMPVILLVIQLIRHIKMIITINK